MGIKVVAIDHVTLNVSDISRAKKFYRELLALEEIDRPKSFDFPGAWYRAGAVLIHLVAPRPSDPNSTHHFCLWVTDIREAAKAIADAGYEVHWDKRKIPGVDRFFTRDPDGNQVEFQGSDGTVWNA